MIHHCKLWLHIGLALDLLLDIHELVILILQVALQIISFELMAEDVYITELTDSE